MPALEAPRPCRFCLLDCWGTTDAGVVEHPCCAWWATQPEPGCPACRESLRAQGQTRRPSSAPPPARWEPPPNRRVAADTVASI
jgi:hypothetical protein